MPSWYLEWISAYLAANDANNVANQAMLKTWWRGFDAIRATAEEMGQATYDVLSLENRPVRTADHFAAIKRAVVARRADAVNRAIADYSAEDRGACVLCGNTGSVTVPHGNYSNGERWRPVYTTTGKEQFVTCAVVCPCERGRRIVACQMNNEKAPKQMTLDTYEQQVNGHWKEQMQEQRQRNWAVVETESSIDPNQLLKNLANSMAAKR